MNILFYSPEFHDWTDCIKNIKVSNIKVYITSTDNIDELLNLLKSKKIYILIPCRFDQMRFITTNYDKIKKAVKNIICPKNYDIIELLDNKIKFREFMINNKFQNLIPITYKISNYIEHKTTSIYTQNKQNSETKEGPKLYSLRNKTKVLEPIVYPCIFKLAKTHSGLGSYICKNKNELLECQKIHKTDQSFVQEYIYDINQYEYAVHMFIYKGNIKWSVCYKLTHPSKLFIQRGKMDEYEKIDKFDYSTFEKIFKVVNYTGFTCIDFKMIDNNIKIFEINPRLGGTLVNNLEDFNLLIKCVSDHYSNEKMLALK
jgi:predicted ATP-grasp superfamily ATP-dependent carboligase